MTKFKNYFIFQFQSVNELWIEMEVELIAGASVIFMFFILAKEIKNF
jgi:hypothetical protein